MRFGRVDFIELPEEPWAGVVDFVEYRVNKLEDVSKCLADRHFCIAHAPDPQEAGWEQCVEAIADVPSVALVNAHARPDDEYTLCRNCFVRQVNTRRAGQTCDYCGSGLEPDQTDIAISQNTLAAVSDQLAWAAAKLRSSGKVLTVENTYEPPELLVRLFERLPTDVRFTLDVGHAALYHKSPLDYVYLLRDRLGHLHLHDNMGGNSERHNDSHLPPGAGSVNWYAVVRALKQVGFNGTATFECYPVLDWVEAWQRSFGNS